MGVNNVWLKVAEIVAKGNEGSYELQRTTCLIEKEMPDFEPMQKWFIPSAGRSDRHHMTLLGLPGSQVNGDIDDAVAKVGHIVRYVQNPHLLLLFAFLVRVPHRGE
jgi:hypothetical protein